MTIERYAITDIEVKGEANVSNPFTARVEGRFSGPNGKVLRIPGFYDGDSTWKIRFSPVAPGDWSYTIRSTDIPGADGTSGVITCIEGSRKGAVKVSDTRPFHFDYENGTPHFMNAYECDWLWAYDQGRDDLSRTEALVSYLKKYRFNTVLMNAYAHDSDWTPGTTSEHDYGPPALFLWEGTNEEPDHQRLNIEFFRHFDRVMNILEGEGLVVHLFLKVYNKMVRWPEPLTPEDDLYFSYLTARYQAYWNITWDFAKESKNEVNKDYLYDRITFVKALDAYRRMITTHDDPGYFTSAKGVKSVDFFTAQQHHHFYDSALVTKHRYGIPYFNSEFGYEHGPDGVDDLTYSIGQSPEELAHRAYEVVMAGGYPAYYYTYTAWDVIDPSYDPPGANYFKILYEFFTSLDWQNFEPMLEYAHPNMGRCLARGKEELIVFTSDDRHRGHVFITADIDIADYDCTWMDIYSGKRVPVTEDLLRSNVPGKTSVNVPFESGLGILHMKKK